MNAMDQCVAATGPVPIPQTPVPNPSHGLHRLAEVRRRERLTCRRVAQMSGLSLDEVERQEKASSDIRLSDLYRWAKAMSVPAAELLDESEGELSPPVRWRAGLLRIMKTVRSIQANARQTSIRRLADMLSNQLIELMPELKDTAAWPSVGHQRRRHDFGQAFYRRISLGLLDDAEPPV